MTEDERKRLVANIAGGLSQVSRDDVVEKNLAHLHAADPEYGRRVEEAVRALREDRPTGSRTVPGGEAGTVRAARACHRAPRMRGACPGPARAGRGPRRLRASAVVKGPGLLLRPEGKSLLTRRTAAVPTTRPFRKSLTGTGPPTPSGGANDLSRPASRRRTDTTPAGRRRDADGPASGAAARSGCGSRWRAAQRPEGMAHPPEHPHIVVHAPRGWGYPHPQGSGGGSRRVTSGDETLGVASRSDDVTELLRPACTSPASRTATSGSGRAAARTTGRGCPDTAAPERA